MPRKRRRTTRSNDHEYQSDIIAPKTVTPKTKNQALLLDTINKNLITFVIGKAGCGKTFMSVGTAITHFYNGWIKKIILTRPIQEVGSSMGHLPGTYEEKLHPYLIPLYDELQGLCPKGILDRPEIEIAPLNFIRGRTLKDSFIILDEAQNCTYEQLKVFLTRFGEGSKMVINGDVTQSDLPKHKQGALTYFSEALEGLDLLGVVRLGGEDVVRHEIVGRMLARLEETEAKTEF